MLRVPSLCSRVKSPRVTPIICSLHHRTFANRRSTIPSERNWDPNEIFPNTEGQVRICGITMRDGHQSLNGGLHRIDLLSKVAPLMDKIRPSSMKYPGCEEIGGGTTVDFPLRFKGENPFRNMEIMSSQMPNTPTSVLIRSDSLCGYNINPRDVVHSFITRYAQVGIDIFRVFDAYNNVENQATVAKAILSNGKHYQAAITFTSHEDPTLFNPAWVGEMAESFAKLGAHSICIKDMAGIASPKLMTIWVKAIKAAVPHLPIHIHSHYTTGFAPLTYIQAIEAGASCIDCAVSTLSGRSGHPAMEVFNQTLFDLGYDLGWDYKQALSAMKEVADIYREYHPRYEFCEMKMAGAVDYRVFTQGIPGGQISIMRNELVRNGYGHLFDKVIDQIQRVRTQVGGVALVTPTSEHVARQSIVNAMNSQDETNDLSPLWPGYSEMLRGVMGRPPLAPDSDLQKRALREWTLDAVKSILKDKDVSNDVRDAINDCVPNVVDYMWMYSEPIRFIRDAKDLDDRIRQLTVVDQQAYAPQIQQSQKELSELKQKIGNAGQKEDDRYTSILKCEPDSSTYDQLLSESGLKSFVNDGHITRVEFLDIIKAASFCTVCPSSIIPENGMELSRNAVEMLAVEKVFYPPQRGSVEFEEYAILQCMFKHAQNIAQFWFQNNDENEQFWDKNFPDDFEFDREIGDGVPPVPQMYPYRTKISSESVVHPNIEWSETELNRVLGQDIRRMRALRTKYAKIEGYKADNDDRRELKERELGEVGEKIKIVESVIQAKLKTSVYNVRCHEAGYEVNVDDSVRINWNKVESMKI